MKNTVVNVMDCSIIVDVKVMCLILNIILSGVVNVLANKSIRTDFTSWSVKVPGCT